MVSRNVTKRVEISNKGVDNKFALRKIKSRLKNIVTILIFDFK